MTWLKREGADESDSSLSEPFPEPEGERRTGPSDPLAAAPEAGAPVRRPVARFRLLGAGLLCLLNAGIAVLLLLQHHGVSSASAAVSQVCGDTAGGPTGCDVVNQSAYSEWRGVPLAAAGTVVYGSLAALLLLGLLAGPEPRTAAAVIAFVTLTAALAVDAVLLVMQMVVIRAFCAMCVLTYLVGGLALALLWPARQAFRSLFRGLAGDGRLLFAGWAAATIALVAGVYAAEQGLGWRDQAAARSIFGASLPPASLSVPSATPPPAAAPAGAPPEVQRYQEEARAASEQARRLQEILDDPQRLERYFAERAEREYEQGPVHALKLEGVPLEGPAEAPIKVVEYSDFLCPFCRNIAGAFDSFLPHSQGRVAIYFKNYPLDADCNPNVAQTVHPGACELALGGICARQQGKFWPYHDRVFSNPPVNPSTDDVVRIAGEAGLDASALRACVGSGAAQETLAAQVKEAAAAGVNGTPTLFLNGRRLPRVNDFLAMVDKESARLGLPPLPKQ